jgi:predicted transcriptional regulator
MKNEITRKSVLTKAMEMDFSEDEKAVIAKMIASLDKRNTKTGVSEKVQAERDAEMATIAEFLADGKVATATEIAKATDLSVQKVSARMKVMVANGEIFNKPAKGKSKAQFSVNPFEDAE